MRMLREGLVRLAEHLEERGEYSTTGLPQRAADEKPRTFFEAWHDLDVAVAKFVRAVAGVPSDKETPADER